MKTIHFILSAVYLIVVEFMLLFGLFLTQPGLIVIAMAVIAARWFVSKYYELHQEDDFDDR